MSINSETKPSVQTLVGTLRHVTDGVLLVAGAIGEIHQSNQAVPESVSGSSANEVPLDLRNGMFGQVFVNFGKNSVFHVGMKSMTQVCKRAGWSHNDECLYVAGANDLFHGGRGTLSKVMLLEFMPVRHLHAAASTCSRALDRASRVIGALLVSRWIFLGKDALCLQIKKLLITIIIAQNRAA